MMLSDRKKRILGAIIDDYIETTEPVGSKTIAPGLGLSSATIRNEMAELTSMGFLEQPHTSAGRVPSAKGYRIYVNELMRRQRLSLEETEEINRSLRQRLQQLDHMISDVGRLASQVTSLPAYALTTAPARTAVIVRFDLIYVDPNTFIIVAMMSDNTVKNKLIRLPISVEQSAVTKLATVFNSSFTNIREEQITTQLISAAERAVGDTIGLVAVVAAFVIEILSTDRPSETYVTGTSNLLQHPEYHDVDKAQKLLSYLSDGNELLKLPSPGSGTDVKFTIGPENEAEELKDSSVAVAKFDAGDGAQGLIGVVGPTRMNYSRVAARLSYLADSISRMFASGEPAPPGSDEHHDK